MCHPSVNHLKVLIKLSLETSLSTKAVNVISVDVDQGLDQAADVDTVKEVEGKPEVDLVLGISIIEEEIILGADQEIGIDIHEASRAIGKERYPRIH